MSNDRILRYGCATVGKLFRDCRVRLLDFRDIYDIRLRDCRDTVAWSSGYGCATVGIRLREVRDTVARLSGYGCVKFGIRLRNCRDTVAWSSGYGCATVGIRLREVRDTVARLSVGRYYCVTQRIRFLHFQDTVRCGQDTVMVPPLSGYFIASLEPPDFYRTLVELVELLQVCGRSLEVRDYFIVTVGIRYRHWRDTVAQLSGYGIATVLVFYRHCRDTSCIYRHCMSGYGIAIDGIPYRVGRYRSVGGWGLGLVMFPSGLDHANCSTFHSMQLASNTWSDTGLDSSWLTRVHGSIDSTACHVRGFGSWFLLWGRP